MKRSSVLVLATIGFVSLYAREFRTPLPLLRHWMHEIKCEKECLRINFWSGYYQRKASEALVKNKKGSSTVPLSHLLFGASNFEAQEAFADSSVSAPFDLLLSTPLFPRFKYTDRGAVFGLDVGKEVMNCVRLGVRLMLPVRSFKMKCTRGPGVGSSQLGGRHIRDVVTCGERRFNNDECVDCIKTCAYRLDFLSQLPVDCVEPGVKFKIVNYRNEQFPTKPITMSNQDVTDNPALNPKDRNPVTVLKQDDGCVPTNGLSLPIAEAQSLPALPGDGSSVPDGGRARFVTNTNYTPLGNDQETQEQFWVVNTVDTANRKLVDPALILQEHALDVLDSLGAESAEELLSQCGISFCTEKSSGVGDLDSEYYSQWYWEDESFTELLLGLRLPTGKRQKDPGKILLQPLGNNGHVEVRLGTRTYWEPTCWLFLQGNASYSFVLNRKEFVAAPFLGACVKNIGPCIPARIKWGYFLGHLELGVKPLESYDCHSLVARVGYEAYVKQRDSVELCQNSKEDCIGALQRLCAKLLERNTDVVAHKLYGEVSYRYDFESVTLGIFGGGGGVVGGKNTPKDRDWYIGIECCF